MKAKITFHLLLTIIIVSSVYEQGELIDESFYNASLDTARIVDI